MKCCARRGQQSFSYYSSSDLIDSRLLSLYTVLRKGCVCIFKILVQTFFGRIRFILLKKHCVYSFAITRGSFRSFAPNIMQVHPDRDPSNPALHTQFVALNEAYHVLSKELSRKEYDTKIRHSYGGGQAFRSTSSYASPGAR